MTVSRHCFIQSVRLSHISCRREAERTEIDDNDDDDDDTTTNNNSNNNRTLDHRELGRLQCNRESAYIRVIR